MRGTAAILVLLVATLGLFVKSENITKKNERDEESRFIYDITNVVDHTLKGSVSREVFIGFNASISNNWASISKVNGTTLTYKIPFKSSNLPSKLSMTFNGITSFNLSAGGTISSKRLSGLAAVIFQIEDEDCENSELENHITEIKSEFKSLGIQVGFLNSTFTSCPPLLENTDMVFTFVNFTTQYRFPASYSLFRKRLHSLVENSTNVYLQLDSLEGTRTNSDIDYNHLFSNFSKRFADENKCTVIIRISMDFHGAGTNVKSIEDDLNGRSKYMSLEFHQFFCGSISEFDWLQVFYWLNMASSVFQKVLLPNSASFCRFSNFVDVELPLSHILNATVQLSEINRIDDLSKTINNVIAFKGESKKLNLLLEDIFLSPEYSRLSERNSTKAVAFPFVAKALPIGCGGVEYFSNFIDQPLAVIERTRESCGTFFDQATRFQWPLELNFGKAKETNFSFDYFLSVVQYQLNWALVSRHEFWKIKPKAQVTLKIHWDHIVIARQKENFMWSFYCNRDKLEWNTYLEGIGNWARIHNFPVIFSNQFHSENYRATSYHEGNAPWSIIEILGEIIQYEPHIVVRNFPEGFLNLKVDPCVKWSEYVKVEGIPLNKDFSGVSLSMDLKEEGLSMKELQTLLLFALDRFKTVELLPKKGEGLLKDLQTLNSLLDTDFLEALVDFDILDGTLHLEISADTPGILKEVESIGKKISQGPDSGMKLAGIHMTSVDERFSQDIVIKKVIALGKKYNFKVGLVVKNCTKLVQDLLFGIKMTTLTASNASYVLCVTKNVPAHNENKEDLAKFLDSHLYISRMLKRFLPKKPVYFRVDSFPCCEGDAEKKKTEKLFRFLNDVNQFAVGNQLKYFLIQAFTTTSESYSSSSWFTVTMSEDSHYPFVIMDKEEEIIRIISPEFSPPRIRANITRILQATARLEKVDENSKAPAQPEMEDENFQANLNILMWIVVGLGAVIFVVVLLALGPESKSKYKYIFFKV